MIQNKDSFLERIANQLGRPRIMDGVERPKWTTSPQYNVHKNLSTEELIDVLKKRCGEIHTDFYRTTIEALPEMLQGVLKNYGAKTVIAPWDKRNETFGLTDFYEKLAERGIDFFEWDQAKGEENIRFAEQADVGITFSEITLAESATVTLFNDTHNGRVLSLLPQSYIAIIPKSTIVPRLTQATKQIHEANAAGKRPPSCVSFISGPSNSADIEMNLIVGVHGPVRAAYIVVDDG